MGKVTLYPKAITHGLWANTLGLDYGWLASDESFLSMKDWLKSNKIKFLVTCLTDLITADKDIIFDSNIRSWKRCGEHNGSSIHG